MVCRKREGRKKGYTTANQIKQEEIAKNKIENAKKIKIKVFKKTIHPKIKGSKIKTKTTKLRYGLALSFDEKKFLLKKHMDLGLEFNEAKEKVERDKLFLSDLVKKMKEKDKSYNEINKVFKEEFAKLIQKEVKNENK